MVIDTTFFEFFKFYSRVWFLFYNEFCNFECFICVSISSEWLSEFVYRRNLRISIGM